MTKPDSSPLTIQQVANSFLVVGRFNFWVQIVLGVVAAVTLLFAGLFNRPATGPNVANPQVGLGFGVFIATISLFLVGGGIYFASRYIRMSRQLRDSDLEARPRKSEAIQLLKLGLTINLVGMLLTLVGMAAVVGGLAIKASRPQGVSPLTTPIDLINNLDILTVQAIVVILLALYIGIVSPLWLLNRITR